MVVDAVVALLLSMVSGRGWPGSSELSGITAGAAHRDDEDEVFGVVGFWGVVSVQLSQSDSRAVLWARNHRHSQRRLLHLL